MRKVFTRVGLASLALVGLAALSAVAVACGDDDDSSKTPTAAAQSQDQKDVQAAIDKINTSLQNKDVDGLLAGFTDNGAQALFGASKDDVKGNPDALGEATPFTTTAITVSGTKASATGNTAADPSSQFDAPQVLSLVKDADGWKVDGVASGNAKAPSGAKTVTVGMKEFEFDFTPSDIPSGKPILFHLKNTGAQAHFMDLAKIPADAKIDDLLNYQGDGPPPGVTDIGSSNPIEPGKEADVAFTGKLDAGRYVLLCFMPDTDGTPHALKGMVADFTIK